VVLTQGADGSLANDLFVVRGILGPITDGTDRGAVFLPLTTLRELLVVPEGLHQLIVRTPIGAPLDPAPVAALVPGADVRTWRQLMPTVASMLDATRSVLFLVIFLVYVAVGILVLNAMLMAVFERIREFGVMKALGTGPGLVFRVILAESAIQIGLALGIGLALAAPVGVYLTVVGLDVSWLAGTSVVGLSLPSVWYAEFDVASVGTPVVVLVLVVTAAVLWPATKAARLRPLDAMRYR
ncbi:MAG: FtsX-like permease family protein, partial [Myxococcota bacterium]